MWEPFGDTGVPPPTGAWGELERFEDYMINSEHTFYDQIHDPYSHD